MSDARDAWMAFLNPEVVRAKFMAAGLFLVAHEMLVYSVKSHLVSFYADTWTKDGPRQSEAYRRKVLALDPTGKSDPLRGSLAWLEASGVIDTYDLEVYRALTDKRNEVAHELTQIMTASTTPNFPAFLEETVRLVGKIERWWIINVELDTDPDFNGEDVDIESVVPGVLLTLEMLGKVALGDEEEAWELHRHVQEHWPEVIAKDGQQTA